MHEVLVNRLGGLSLPRKSVVRLTDRPDMTLDVYGGRKTTIQQQQYFRLWYFKHPIREAFASSLGPHKMPHNLASDQGPRMCCEMCFFKKLIINSLTTKMQTTKYLSDKI